MWISTHFINQTDLSSHDDGIQMVWQIEEGTRICMRYDLCRTGEASRTRATLDSHLRHFFGQHVGFLVPEA